MVIAFCVPGLQEHFVLTEITVYTCREELKVLVMGEELQFRLDIVLAFAHF